MAEEHNQLAQNLYKNDLSHQDENGITRETLSVSVHVRSHDKTWASNKYMIVFNS